VDVELEEVEERVCDGDGAVVLGGGDEVLQGKRLFCFGAGGKGDVLEFAVGVGDLDKFGSGGDWGEMWTMCSYMFSSFSVGRISMVAPVSASTNDLHCPIQARYWHQIPFSIRNFVICICGAGRADSYDRKDGANSHDAAPDGRQMRHVQNVYRTAELKAWVKGDDEISPKNHYG
jgi:hypothetical protein